MLSIMTKWHYWVSALALIVIVFGFVQSYTNISHTDSTRPSLGLATLASNKSSGLSSPINHTSPPAATTSAKSTEFTEPPKTTVIWDVDPAHLRLSAVETKDRVPWPRELPMVPKGPISDRAIQAAAQRMRGISRILSVAYTTEQMFFVHETIILLCALAEMFNASVLEPHILHNAIRPPGYTEQIKLPASDTALYAVDTPVTSIPLGAIFNVTNMHLEMIRWDAWTEVTRDRRDRQIHVVVLEQCTQSHQPGAWAPLHGTVGAKWTTHILECMSESTADWPSEISAIRSVMTRSDEHRFDFAVLVHRARNDDLTVLAILDYLFAELEQFMPTDCAIMENSCEIHVSLSGKFYKHTGKVATPHPPTIQIASWLQAAVATAVAVEVGSDIRQCVGLVWRASYPDRHHSLARLINTTATLITQLIELQAHCVVISTDFLLFADSGETFTCADNHGTAGQAACAKMVEFRPIFFQMLAQFQVVVMATLTVDFWKIHSMLGADVETTNMALDLAALVQTRTLVSGGGHFYALAMSIRTTY